MLKINTSERACGCQVPIKLSIADQGTWPGAGQIQYGQRNPSIGGQGKRWMTCALMPGDGNV